jgi:hypothetical protein
VSVLGLATRSSTLAPFAPGPVSATRASTRSARPERSRRAEKHRSGLGSEEGERRRVAPDGSRRERCEGEFRRRRGETRRLNESSCSPGLACVDAVLARSRWRWPSHDPRPREKTPGIRELTELAARGPRRSSQRGPATGRRIRDGTGSTDARAGSKSRFSIARRSPLCPWW